MRGSLWSREDLVQPLNEKYKFDGMTRREVVQILGEPDISEKTDPIREGDDGRTDTYQLSMLNNSSLDFEYDSEDTLTHHAEGIGCLASYFPGPEIRSTTIQENLKPVNYASRKKLPPNPTQMQVKDLKKLWGEPDMTEINIVPNFPTPLRTSFYSWRASPDGRTYNLAETTEPFNVDPDHRHVASLVSITLSPQCPVRRRSEPTIK